MVTNRLSVVRKLGEDNAFSTASATKASAAITQTRFSIVASLFISPVPPASLTPSTYDRPYCVAPTSSRARLFGVRRPVGALVGRDLSRPWFALVRLRLWRQDCGGKPPKTKAATGRRTPKRPTVSSVWLCPPAPHALTSLRNRIVRIAKSEMPHSDRLCSDTPRGLTE